MTAFDVLVAGPASWNRIVHLDALPQPVPHTVFANDAYDAVGGTSAGKALNLAALGRSVLLRTVLGADDEGALVTAELERAGVRVAADPSPDARTESHLNLMDPHGGRLSIYLRAPEPPRAASAWGPAIDDARVVVADLAPATLPLLDEATARARDIWTDIHDYDGENPFHRPWIEAATHLFMSSDRMTDYRGFMSERLEAGSRLVVCTHGARGATALTDDGFVDIDAERVERVVDTNGAGDAFFAGFLDAHLAEASLEQALRAAALHAARSVQSRSLAPAAS